MARLLRFCRKTKDVGQDPAVILCQSESACERFSDSASDGRSDAELRKAIDGQSRRTSL